MEARPRTSVLTLVLVVLVMWFAAPASATSVVSSFPSDGSSVPELPTTLVITFSDDLAPTATASVTGPDGPIAVTPMTSGHDLIVDLPSRSPAGGYSMAWTVTPVTGAALSGTLSFTAQRPAGEAPVVPPIGDPDPEPTDVAGTAPETTPPSAQPAPSEPGSPQSAAPAAGTGDPTAAATPDSRSSSPSLTSGPDDADTTRSAGRIWPAVVALMVAALAVAGLWWKRRNSGA